jgi:GDPmannose 4,6-dehydratase
MTERRALIFGVAGQDGAYLARLLHRRGYDVHGTSRHPTDDTSGMLNLHRLGIEKSVRVHRISPLEPPQVNELVATLRPTEIYYLAGQASVALSFEQPAEAISSHVLGALNVLEAIRRFAPAARFLNASSSEIFGRGDGRRATEDSPIRPITPYGVAKAASTALVATYRDAYGLHVCSGILFPHESPIRPESYVTARIVNAAVAIAQRRTTKLELGNLQIVRDWGWAPDFVECMWLMLQRSEPRDFVIATGVACSLEKFLGHVFERLGLDWRQHVTVDAALLRPSDVAFMVGDPERARAVLGWSATLRMPELADRLVDAAQA